MSPISPQMLGQLLDLHWGELVAWVGPADAMAEDVVQQAFIALAGQREMPENPQAWLYRTTRNLWINQSKQESRRRARQREVARHERQPSSAERRGEAAELVLRLRDLPEPWRQVVVARLWGDFSFQEIASMLGKSRATVWRHYRDALQELRKHYGVPCPTRTTTTDAT